MGSRVHSIYDDDESFIRSYHRNQKPKKIKAFEEEIKSYWRGMQNRVKTELYARNGIKVIWSFEEFSKWFTSNKERFYSIRSAGEVPSIDRIDSRKHYEESNCRMIPNSVNRALGEVNGLIIRMNQLQTFLKANEHWLKK